VLVPVLHYFVFQFSVSNAVIYRWAADAHRTQKKENAFKNKKKFVHKETDTTAGQKQGLRGLK
jgi:hypothetical protein